MPGKDDYLADFGRFERWLDGEFARGTSMEQLGAPEYVNTMLMHLGRYLNVVSGAFELDERKLFSLCATHEDSFLTDRATEAVQRHLRGDNLPDNEVRYPRGYVANLRDEVNSLLGI